MLRPHPPGESIRISEHGPQTWVLVSKLSWVIIKHSLSCKPVHHAVLPSMKVGTPVPGWGSTGNLVSSVSLQGPLPYPTIYSSLCSFVTTIWRSNMQVEVITKHCHSRIWSQVHGRLSISIYRPKHKKTQTYYSHPQKGSIILVLKPFIPKLITNIWKVLLLSFHKSSKSGY